MDTKWKSFHFKTLNSAFSLRESANFNSPINNRIENRWNFNMTFYCPSLTTCMCLFKALSAPLLRLLQLFLILTHRFVLMIKNSFGAVQQYTTCLQGSGRGSLRAGQGEWWVVAWYLAGWMSVSGEQSIGREGRWGDQRGSATWLHHAALGLGVRVRLEWATGITLAARVKAGQQWDFKIRIWLGLDVLEGEGTNVWHPAGQRLKIRAGLWKERKEVAVRAVWRWLRWTEQVAARRGIYLVEAASTGPAIWICVRWRTEVSPTL